MAALLNLLPLDVPIITVDSSRIIREGLGRPVTEPACYLAHEIGSGDWYGYIWGQDVADFFSLIDGQRRIASCLHADILEELTGILCGPPLLVSREALGHVGLVLFMHVNRGPSGLRRRVARFYGVNDHGGHQLVFRWDSEADVFEQVGQCQYPDGSRRHVDFLRRLVDQGVADNRAVRKEIIGFYGVE
jgi:hypothetical protein